MPLYLANLDEAATLSEQGGMPGVDVWVLPHVGGPAHPLKTCSNCAHSVSSDPKCGMCCGAYKSTTRWTPIILKKD